MNYVFLMDPLENVVVDKDTSLALMVGAHHRGHKVYYLADGGIVRTDNKLQFHVREVTPQYKKDEPFIDQGAAVLVQDDVHVIFIRTDPPFDERYLHNTWLLDLLPEYIPVINSPSGIRTANEKIWATQFTSIIPKTMIASQRNELFHFVKTEKDVIVKPTASFGGQSIFHIKNNDLNTKVILETLTANWTRDIIVQKYIPEAQQGDKRILILDGEPLGAVLRLHADDDHRNNFASGGKPLSIDITKRDQEIIDHLRPKLKKLGLHFVGIDIIGDYLIEVNVTSPTCLQEMNKLYHCHLEDSVIKFSEKLVDQFSANNRIALWKE